MVNMNRGNARIHSVPRDVLLAFSLEGK